ncbi:MAG: GPP34 family phosphoprotein [Candidatus Thermoplasmatota archaeon]
MALKPATRKPAKTTGRKVPTRRAKPTDAAPDADVAASHAVPSGADAAPESTEAGPVSVPEGDWAEAIAKARRKPVQLDDEGQAPLQVEVRDIPVPDANPEDEPEFEAEVAEADAPTAAEPAAPRTPALTDGLSLPEQYLLIAMGEGWDDRIEKYRVGAHGPAIVGALILDLALRGRLRIQRDRFEVLDGRVGDADLAAIADRLRQLQGVPSAEAMRRLGAGDLTGVIRPWKNRLAARNLVRERTWRHLGLFKRSETTLIAPDAQTKLENRLVRLLSGGTADGQSICLMGLIDAAGLLPNLVPSAALPFNRARIQGLVAGRDKLGYLIDRDFKGMQEVLVATVLRNVKKAQQGR